MKNIKFGLSIIIFSFIFSSVLYIKLKNFIILGLFLTLVISGLFCIINKTFAIKFKTILNKISNFIIQKIVKIVLFFIFVFSVIPMKIVAVLFKRDRLKLRTTNQNSYWINYEEKNDWENQY